MTRKSTIIAVVLLALVTFVGVMGYTHTSDHVRRYTGLEPEGLSCHSCHFVGRGGTLTDRLLPPTYRSPVQLAISSDGQRLYATASESSSLLAIDLRTRELLWELPVAPEPHGLALSDDGLAYVTSRYDDSVVVVELEGPRVTSSIEVGFEPTGVAVVGERLYVANRLSDDVAVVDRASGQVVRRLLAGSGPMEIAVSPDGQRALVGSELSFANGPRRPPISEVTEIDTTNDRVVRRHRMVNAHLIEGIAYVGSRALVTLVRPKNLVPALGVARGWMMTTGLGVIDTSSGRIVQVPLDEPGRFFADPSDIVTNGRLAFVSHSGVDVVTAIDVERLFNLVDSTADDEVGRLANHLGAERDFVVARIPVGANPKGMVLSPDGRELYVAERLADRIAIIDVETLQVTGSIEVGDSETTTVLRHGERLFNSAGQTFQGQFSCRSCHPSNDVDRLQYDFEPDGLGRNILDNRSLLGIDGTHPFKWNGKNTSMYMQCGMRFAKFLTRVEPFPRDDLNALVAFMRSLEPGPNRYRSADGRLSPAQARGKVLFERGQGADGAPIPEKDRCHTCHPAPRFTNRELADVGSTSLGDSVVEFDTPQLNNIATTAPYLHDGKALTLEEIWTRFNPEDTHGITSDFSKDDLNDLIEYLKAL